ncbi:hypothetical protein C2S51_006027 [Perilla frutescens var. frutescens]|nr:hypothetical protein C2S51_006027 [Perilla frutescens var. frutescens]
MFTEKIKSAAACLMILVFFHQPVSRVIGVNARLPLLVNPQTLQQSQYVTLTGCSSDCDIACCYCDITTQPPICVQCCQGDP